MIAEMIIGRRLPAKKLGIKNLNVWTKYLVNITYAILIVEIKVKRKLITIGFLFLYGRWWINPLGSK